MLPVNSIVEGDCLAVMREWPEESIDFAMFSPPYWGLRNYGASTETVWDGDENCSHEWVEEDFKLHSGRGDCQKKAKYSEQEAVPDAMVKDGFCVACGAWKGQLGLEPTWQMYVAHMGEVCRELKRVLKKTGSMYIVLGDTYAGSHCGKGDKRLKPNKQKAQFLYEKPSPQANITDYQPKCLMGVPWRVAFALIDDGWVLRERIVWHKGNPMPGSQKDRLTQTCETIFHFVKNTGKALLWRNELTCEWLSQRPKQVYFHVETHKLRDDRPPKEERYAIDEFGTRHLVWKSLWRGFDYYYELDIIRQPHSTSTIKRVSQKTVFQQKGGIKQDMLRGTRDPSKGNQSRCAEMVKSIAFNLRVRDAKRGKKGFFIEGGKVKQLKASQEEVENYVYPEGLTKHDVAMKNCPTVNREGGLGYTDPLHVKAYHERGKNPGDVIKVQPEGHGHDRLGSRGPGLRPWEERFHPNGKNPGDVVGYNSKYFEPHGQTIQGFIRGQSQLKERLKSREEAKLLFPNDPKKQQEYINFVHDHYGDPKGKNPGDVLYSLDGRGLGTNVGKKGKLVDKEDQWRPQTRLLRLDGKNPGDVLERKEPPRPMQQPQRWERGKNVWKERFNETGKNPGDFWNVCTKPFKGAHFAVYPEAICVNPILSSCPPGGTVLDPMAGSGTTLVVAKKLGRNFVGVEINPAYVAIARKRLEAVPERLDTFL